MALQRSRRPSAAPTPSLFTSSFTRSTSAAHHTGEGAAEAVDEDEDEDEARGAVVDVGVGVGVGGGACLMALVMALFCCCRQLLADFCIITLSFKHWLFTTDATNSSPAELTPDDATVHASNGNILTLTNGLTATATDSPPTPLPPPRSPPLPPV
eukprot:CAMPEP_0119503114 /NCGR_PEP_ID=MMETSP1344-20130328/24386_1 /TAXON_ID=236787 /ORGANISM="Florenciella parvula, Strain CCMP2471" /LENGTH=154 /DNA_ID=CAMNT_0007539377 /DNA_START=287 /DNA_END=748 /DNA_ORIENTATION=+